MSQQQQAAPQAEAAAVVQVDVPAIIGTKWAEVAVFGHEHMSARDMKVLKACLTMPIWAEQDHGVRVVMFRDDDYPVANGKNRKPIFACSCFDSRAIVINLNHTWRKTLQIALRSPEMSIHAVFHQEIIRSYLHEMAHLSPRHKASGRRQMEKDTSAKAIRAEEKEADNFSLEMMFELAKTTNIEPDLWVQSPYFAFHAAALLDGDATKGEEDEWFANQRWMLDNHITYSLAAAEGDNHPVTLVSFKQFCEKQAPEGDEGWDTPTTPEVQTADERIQELINADLTNQPLAPTPGVTEPTLEEMEHIFKNGSKEQKLAMLKTLETQVDASWASAKQEVELGASLKQGLADVVKEYETAVDLPDEYGMEPPEDMDFDEDVFYPQPEQSPTVAAPPVGTAPTAAPQAVYTPPVSAAPNAQGHTFPDPNATSPSMTPVEQPPVNTVQQQAVTLGRTGISEAESAQIAHTVYIKIFQHMFTRCQPTTAHGPDRGFLWPEGATHEYIQLTDREKLVVTHMDCHDMQGRWCPKTPTTNGLLGMVTKDKSMPCYTIYMNFDGIEVCRKVIPQNPAKRGSDGAYSKTALMAQQGTQIAHIFVGPMRQGPHKGRIINGKVEIHD